MDKVWDDADDQDGYRPEALTLTLNVPEGVTAPTPEIEKDGNTWTYTWSGLPKYDDEGEEITYTVTEETVPDKYTCDETTAENGGTITNVHPSETTESTVVKVWDDEDDQDGVRPTSLQVQLKADGEAYGDPVTLTEADVDDDGNWTYTVSNLPKNKNGTAIQYTWTEPTVPSGYTLDEPSTQDTVTTLTNSHDPATITITVYKKWDDSDNQDDIRPDELELTLNGAPEGTAGPAITKDENTDTWTYTWADVPANSGGEPIEYSVTEDEVPTGYTCTYPDNKNAALNGDTITNTHTPEKTSITVTKKWEDNDNQDGYRLTADEFKNKIHLMNGEAVVASTPEVTDNGDGTYTVTFSNLDKYAGGVEIPYTVKEDKIDKYTTTGSPASNEGTITNTHEPETTTVEVKKVWDDNEDKLGLRPETVDVQLLADGKLAETVVLSEENNWSYQWETLPKYKEGEVGQLIEYTVDEAEVPEGYIKTVDGFTITNKLATVSVDPPVQKIIEGNDSLYNKGDFTFEITNIAAETEDGQAITEAPMPTYTKITNSSMWERKDKPGFYEFGEIVFTQPGTYTYKVTESGKVDGVTNDPDAEKGKTITFTVTQNEDGSLSVTPGTDEAQFTFTNKYTAQPATGDYNNTILWMIAMIAAGLVAAGLIVMGLRKRAHAGSKK